jgi:hypothetical protein
MSGKADRENRASRCFAGDFKADAVIGASETM